ncbi:LacI family DNA-binding transcriptional regulator [Paenibacillus allorhizosphaerae]|uniref:HTH-type transcriptional repressor CytR n=1 Tax=Paenibacillus allorhizosphaerae TaxID=2849866 RepID=A0ABN7TNI4_9BACL|nr:LacI family DNA-binding transcriptional regulator [Paenibacillus allorhizosphaerae]CAG7648664.1 HTH-type transcriptional repressor CytR [Paenibacillus allorhizosphaerae]
MPKLKDIAQHVGVSISTVSRVINNDSSRHISQETKSKIWNAIKELGYEPNETARQLARKSEKDADQPSRQIGCIVSAPQHKYNHPYFSPILAGIEKKLAELNYSLAFVHTLEEMQSESAMGKLVETKLDGMVIVEGIPSDLYAYIKKVIPVVVGIDITDPFVPVITYDRVQAAKSAVRHLLDQGHRKIGFIGGAGLTGDIEREKRYRGYRYALQEAGLEADPRLIINAGWDVNASYGRMAELLQEDRSLWPTAVFAASDMMAISAMRAVVERGLHIPEDIAFVGLDDIEVSQFTSPPLSTVHVPKFEMGLMAAKVMVDQITDSHPLPFKLFMPFELLIRQSSDYVRNNG